jgi:UDP-glucose 4-epimerase
MQTVLVTGGTGFIGSHTAVALIEAGFQPIILDNLSNSSEEVVQMIEQITGVEAIPFYQGDCQDATLLSYIFEQHQPQGVIHFAAYKAVGESVQKPLKYYQNNLGALLQILATMQRYEVKPLVFSSSCTVYGQPAHLPVSEESPIQQAASPYGNTKKICEEILRDVSKTQALQVLSLRYFNPIGAHPSGLIGELPLGVPNNLVPYITQTAAGLREKLSIFGDDYPTPDGTCIRDFIHVMDLAEAHVAALQLLQKQENAHYFEALNIGTGRGHSVMELVNTFIEVTGQALPHIITGRRPGDIDAIYAQADKAQSLLGWKPQRKLEEALSDAWRWQKYLGKRG